MPKPLVFWRTDEEDDYVHTEKDCVEIANAKTVQCGAIEDAQRSGHTRACPYCQKARNLPERKEADVVKIKADAPAVQKAPVWIATLAAVACTWLCCLLYYNEQNTDIKMLHITMGMLQQKRIIRKRTKAVTAKGMTQVNPQVMTMENAKDIQADTLKDIQKGKIL